MDIPKRYNANQATCYNFLTIQNTLRKRGILIEAISIEPLNYFMQMESNFTELWIASVSCHLVFLYHVLYFAHWFINICINLHRVPYEQICLFFIHLSFFHIKWHMYNFVPGSTSIMDEKQMLYTWRCMFTLHFIVITFTLS